MPDSAWPNRRAVIVKPEGVSTAPVLGEVVGIDAVGNQFADLLINGDVHLRVVM